jgi:hypothetical protein
MEYIRTIFVMLIFIAVGAAQYLPFSISEKLYVRDQVYQVLGDKYFRLLFDRPYKKNESLVYGGDRDEDEIEQLEE